MTRLVPEFTDWFIGARNPYPPYEPSEGIAKRQRVQAFLEARYPEHAFDHGHPVTATMWTLHSYAAGEEWRLDSQQRRTYQSLMNKEVAQ